MKHFDQGLGAIGVLALFVVLAVLLGVGLPVIKSEAPLKASDWLGFAGNIIAAVFAAAAAVVAWVAAQRQIRHAALQNSVIAYGTLKEVLAAMNADANTTAKIGFSLDAIELYSHDLVQSPSGEPSRSFGGVQGEVEKLTNAIEHLRDAAANPWGNEVTRRLRARMIQAVSVYLALGHIQMALNMTEDGVVSDEDASRAFADDSWSVAIRSTKEFQIALGEEMKRIYSLIDAHFANFTKPCSAS